jgi:hypothetical protein
MLAQVSDAGDGVPPITVRGRDALQLLSFGDAP